MKLSEQKNLNYAKPPYFMCISKMPQYQGKTKLQLQLEDYKLMKKNELPDNVRRLVQIAIQNKAISPNSVGGNLGQLSGVPIGSNNNFNVLAN